MTQHAYVSGAHRRALAWFCYVARLACPVLQLTTCNRRCVAQVRVGSVLPVLRVRAYTPCKRRSSDTMSSSDVASEEPPANLQEEEECSDVVSEIVAGQGDQEFSDVVSEADQGDQEFSDVDEFADCVSEAAPEDLERDDVERDDLSDCASLPSMCDSHSDSGDSDSDSPGEQSCYCVDSDSDAPPGSSSQKDHQPKDHQPKKDHMRFSKDTGSTPQSNPPRLPKSLPSDAP